MNYFTKQQLLTMLQLQKEANDVMSDSWLSSVNGCPSEGGISYYRAAMVEAMEAVGHSGFKWWKKETPNIEQLNLELIDIKHFALSDFYRSHQHNLENIVDNLLENIKFGGLGKKVESIEEMRDAFEAFATRCYKLGSASLYHTIELCYRFGLSANYVYNMYVGKNTLNKFRTANGQREDKYIKIWHGEEDNIYLEKYLKALDNEYEIDVAHLNNYLTECYAEVLKEASNG